MSDANSNDGLSNSEIIDMEKERSKCLVFRLGDELYATPLISIREISKMQSIKPVPYMVPYFLGILNLRGQIVGVVDLRIKLDLPIENYSDGLLIIIDTENGLIGVIVDDVVSVSNFPPEKVEKKIAMRTKIPTDFYLGVGHLDGQMVNLIDISGTLSHDDLASVSRITSARIKETS